MLFRSRSGLVQHAEYKDVDVRLTKLPVCSIQNEGQFLFDGQAGKNQWHDVGLTDREGVKETFDASDDRFKLGCSRKSFSKFSVPDGLCLNQCKDHEDKKLELVFAVILEVSGEGECEFMMIGAIG